MKYEFSQRREYTAAIRFNIVNNCFDSSFLVDSSQTWMNVPKVQLVARKFVTTILAPSIVSAVLVTNWELMVNHVWVSYKINLLFYIP